MLNYHKSSSIIPSFYDEWFIKVYTLSNSSIFFSSCVNILRALLLDFFLGCPGAGEQHVQLQPPGPLELSLR